MSSDNNENYEDKYEEETSENERSYVVLQEVNDKEMESWMYFLRYEGNEKNLLHLEKQLRKVDWYIVEELSTFDLDMEHRVSEQTAREMITLDLNAHQPHRKFDGTLQKIDLNFLRRDSTEAKILKTFDFLGYGQIEDYISEEDIDENQYTSINESELEEEEE